MKKLALMVALAVAVLAGSAQAYVTMTLVAPMAPVAPDSFFDVFVEIDTDINIAMVQAVLDVSDPNLSLTAVDGLGAGLAFLNPPDTAVVDFFPTTKTGVFTAMKLTMYVGPEAVYPLNLIMIDLSSFSTAVFDAGYGPMWDITLNGTSVEVAEEIIPEPATIGLLALVGLGSMVARKK
jgi:hypothetical protein